jgi:hypothetical protein
MAPIQTFKMKKTVSNFKSLPLDTFRSESINIIILYKRLTPRMNMQVLTEIEVKGFFSISVVPLNIFIIYSNKI